MKALALLIAQFSVVCLVSYAQHNLCGIWVNGNSYNKEYDDVLILNEVCGDNVVGYSYDQDERGGFCNYRFVGKIKHKRKKDILKGKCTFSYEKKNGHVATSLKLNVSNKKATTISGKKWITSLGILSTKNVTYRKISLSEFNKNTSYNRLRYYLNKLDRCECVKKKDSVESTQSSDKKRLTERKNKRLNTFKIKYSELTLKLRDANKADGDKISIYLNGELIVSNFEVTKRAKKLSVVLPPGKKEHSLVFVADDLGRTPPNTADIEISNYKDVYRVSLNCDLKTNNEIIIQKP